MKVTERQLLIMISVLKDVVDLGIDVSFSNSFLKDFLIKIFYQQSNEMFDVPEDE